MHELAIEDGLPPPGCGLDIVNLQPSALPVEPLENLGVMSSDAGVSGVLGPDSFDESVLADAKLDSIVVDISLKQTQQC